jgi:hypothetical protein
MNLIFADQPLPFTLTKSLFLAGPSPRTQEDHDWRIEALIELQRLNFTGTVFIPIPSTQFKAYRDLPACLLSLFEPLTGPSTSTWHYDNQISWECDTRHMSDLIVFWVPRTTQMPGFTTNVEFGEDLHTNKMLYGRPETALKCRYLDNRYQETGSTPYTDLAQLLSAALFCLGSGAKRTQGEAWINLQIWNNDLFQTWYTKVKEAGDSLCSAKTRYIHYHDNGKIHSFILDLSVFLTKEARVVNEPVFFKYPSPTALPI